MIDSLVILLPKNAIEYCAPRLTMVKMLSFLRLNGMHGALRRDVEDRWGDGVEGTRVREGLCRQPQGYTPDQMLKTICDPRLY